MRYVKISLFFILAAFITMSTTFVNNKGVKEKNNTEQKITLKERLSLYIAQVETNLHKQEARKMGFFGKVFFKVQKAGVKLIKNALAGDSVIIALLLCFFLGGLAIHRVYLGGTGLLILGYFLTIGGIFGILPLIDFIMIIVDPDRYIDNDAFFGFL